MLTKLIEMLAMVKAGKVGILRDECDRQIALNFCGNSTGVRYAKRVLGHLTVGATEEERQADEEALRKFLEDYRDVDVFKLHRIANTLNKAELTEDDIGYLNCEVESLVRRIKAEAVAEYVREHRSEHQARAERCVETEGGKKRGKYLSLATELESLDDATLKALKNEAQRKGLRDMYNATRKALRAHGYNC